MGPGWVGGPDLVCGGRLPLPGPSPSQAVVGGVGGWGICRINQMLRWGVPHSCGRSRGPSFKAPWTEQVARGFLRVWEAVLSRGPGLAMAPLLSGFLSRKIRLVLSLPYGGHFRVGSTPSCQSYPPLGLDMLGSCVEAIFSIMHEVG